MNQFFNKYKLTIIVLVIFLFPVFSQAATCSSVGYSIFTINGINTDTRGAQENKAALEDKLVMKTYKNEPLTVNFIYNPTHGKIFDALDTTNQIYFDQNLLNIQDSDFTRMLTDASTKLTTQKVLLVSHSQGNFYANTFYDAVADEEGGVPSISIGVYGVATPASRVAGGGLYITSDTDKMISGTVAKFPLTNILKSNVHINFSKNDGDPLGHSFSQIYLSYESNKIISDIKTSLNRLQNNDEQDENSPCIEPPKLTWTQKIQSIALNIVDPVSIPIQAGVVNTVVAVYDAGAYVRDGVSNVGLAIGSFIHNTGLAFGHLVGGLLANVGSSMPDPSSLTTGLAGLGDSNIHPGASATPQEGNNSPSPSQGEGSGVRSVDLADSETTPPITITESKYTPQNPYPNLLLGGGGSAGSNEQTSSSAPDTTPPVISIIGPSSVTFFVGNNYTDLGATALDDVDKDITADIVTVNPVDVNTIGDYTITYDVSDKAGNPAVQVTRIVHVGRSNILYSQPDDSTEISSGAVASFDSFTGASGHIQTIKFAYNDYGNSSEQFIGLSVVDRTLGINYYATADIGGSCGDAYESTGVNKKIIVELDSSVKYKAHPCTGPELVLDPTHTYGVALFRNHGGNDTQKFYGSTNSNDSAYLYVTNDLYPSKNKFVKSFGFPNLGAVGVINEATHRIDITVPFGADVTSLTPTIKISGGASVSPNNNTVQNFSNPIVYTVTAENGDTQTYTVTVSVHSSVVYSQPDNSTEIVSNSIYMQNLFTGAMGNISNLKFSYNDSGNSAGQTVLVQIIDQNTSQGYYAAKAGSTTNCGDAYESTGANQAVIVNLDSTYQYRQYPCVGPNLVLDPTHTYSINIAANKGAAIQKFYGSNSANNAAYLYIESSGIAAPVLSSEKKINTFSFTNLTPNVSGTIDETNRTIALTVPFETDMTNLIPVITISDKASISPDSNIAQDFSNPVTYTVTAEDKSIQTYTVTVTEGQDQSAGTDTTVSKLKIITPTQSVNVNAASAIITVESQNESGISAKATSTIHVNLSSSSGGGTFASASASTGLCDSSWKNINAISIATGSAHRSFCYKDSMSGTPTITVSANSTNGPIFDSQIFTIN
ncbi:DUF5011 domain-containing protein [Candidatus Nomurabacteria bacterium]|nr:DUF5011 domain-containing protein [Candidatus Nomurabacteria bacterium]